MPGWGAACEALRSAPDFHRFRLTRGEEREIIDVVIDRAPQLDAIKANFNGIRVDTLREIIANKLTTLLGRSDLKDVVDLFFLEQAGHDLRAATPDARAKDQGWEPAVVAMLLAVRHLREIPSWMIRDVSIDELNSFLDRLRLAIADQALPEK